MLSMGVQSGINSVFTHSSLPYHTHSRTIIRATIPANPRPSLVHSTNILDRKSRPISRNILNFSALAGPEALTAETETIINIPEEDIPDPDPDPEVERAEVVVEQVEKPGLVLKFVWMEKNIGLALDQVIAGHGTVPLSPYYFWPRKDAWEELKATLESKPWISQKKMIILLNQATDIINLWQQSGGNLTSSSSQ